MSGFLRQRKDALPALGRVTHTKKSLNLLG